MTREAEFFLYGFAAAILACVLAWDFYNCRQKPVIISTDDNVIKADFTRSTPQRKMMLPVPLMQP